MSTARSDAITSKSKDGFSIHPTIDYDNLPEYGVGLSSMACLSAHMAASAVTCMHGHQKQAAFSKIIAAARFVGHRRHNVLRHAVITHGLLVQEMNGSISHLLLRPCVATCGKQAIVVKGQKTQTKATALVPSKKSPPQSEKKGRVAPVRK